MALGLTQPLTENGTRNHPEVIKHGQCVRLTTIPSSPVNQLSRKCGHLNGPPLPVKRMIYLRGEYTEGQGGMGVDECVKGGSLIPVSQYK
jgi:hypothetical protein